MRLQICRYHHRSGAFDSREQSLPEHLVTFVEQGELHATVAGATFRLQAGELLWIAPGQSRRYFGVAETPRTRQYNLRFAVRQNDAHLVFTDRVQRLRQAWAVQPVFQQLYDLFQHGHAHADLRLRGLLLLLGTTVLSLVSEPRDRARILSPAQRLRLNQYIVDHVAEAIAPEDLARAVELSPDYFARLFRATYGRAPRYHLKHERMRLAAIRLRETHRAVAQVARDVGLANVSLFCRQFRDTLGCTPSEYRRREMPPLL